MALTFNLLLQSEGIDPAEVRLLRHQTKGAGGRTPYSLWRDHPDQFEQYQCFQDALQRREFDRPYWASFVVEPQRASTLFVGLYAARYVGPVPEGTIDPLTCTPAGSDKGRTADLYECNRDLRLASFEGRLYLDWGGRAAEMEPTRR